ncbi:MAG TPA: HD family phosphohydrolase [Anoxybacillus sp.]|nr:HD family phosphohydrolase [Anoxybacillus sp.]
MFVLLALLTFVLLYHHVKPEQYNIQLFGISKETIRSPITIEDKEKTEKMRREAADRVADVYTLKKEYAENRVDLISSVFTTISEVQEEADTHLEKLQKLKEKLPGDLYTHMSETQWSSLLTAKPSDLQLAKEATVTAVNKIMSERITLQDLDYAKMRVDHELKYVIVKNELKDAIVQLAKYAIIPNVVYDRAATEEKRRQAMDEVKPVKILQGQIIVEEGQFITNEIYNQLKLVGLLENERTVHPFIGLGIFVILLLTPILYYFWRFKPENHHRNVYLFVYTTVFVLTLIMMKLISLLQQMDFTDVVYVVPVAVGTILIRILFNEQLAVVTSFVYAICGSIMFNEGVTGTFNDSAGVYLLASGLAGAVFLSEQLQKKAKILQAGLFVSLINTAMMIATLFMKNGHYSLIEIGIFVIMAVISGIFASVLTIGLLPFLEAGFGILSSMKLIELSNPNHPLLRKILTEAPGTYHHSLMVANLSEAACEAIGANGLLARVAAYYHDIGKTKRPRYFIENQIGNNHHDYLSPQLSKNIIIAHVTDGVAILKKHKMPKEIIDIAEQHHGTTLLKYFYHKAKQQSDYVLEEEFRYPGPKPNTKEAAIISIADSVEAAVRSLVNPSQEKIEKVVRGIIADRLQDNQFNECNITLKELELVAQSLCETLNGVFHSRIEYPEIRKEKVKQA